MPYNWQQPDWPQFRYTLAGIEDSLFAFAEKTGRVGGLLKGLTADAQMEAAIEMMVVEAIKTSAIEGELLSREGCHVLHPGTISASHPKRPVEISGRPVPLR